MSTTGLQIHQINNIRYYDIYFYGTWQITGALRCFNMQLITHTPSSICTLSATESHLTIINDWIRQKLWAATSSGSSSNTGCVCFRLTAPRRRLHSGEWGGLWVVYHVVFLVKLIRGHLHTRGTARLPPGWQSLRWHVWGPGVWRWPGAVCSLRSAACCPSRWAPRSHFLRSWLEVGSQVQRSASWLCPLLIRKTKWIQHQPVNTEEHVRAGHQQSESEWY